MTPETLYNQISVTVTDKDFILEAVRLRFPDWTPKQVEVPVLDNVPDGPMPEWSNAKTDKSIRAATITLGERIKAARSGSPIKPLNKLLWTREYQGGQFPERHAAGLAAQRQREDYVESLRVNRDPCGRCGVRADQHRLHGCSHYIAGRAGV